MASRQSPAAQASLDTEIAEFLMLFAATHRDLKAAVAPPERLREAGLRFGLGPRHFPPLFTTALAGPLSVTELSERIGLRLSTTSTLVGQLSRAGLLERVEDDDDRRRTIVHLPERHRAEITMWIERACAPVRATLERLSPPARTHFMEGWRILHEEASRSAPADADACAEPNH
jgi:DNA-binding MarR family transcriptional regulator